MCLQNRGCVYHQWIEIHLWQVCNMLHRNERKYLCGETLMERSTPTSQVYESIMTFLWSRHMMEQLSWKCVKTVLVGAGRTLLFMYVILPYLACRHLQGDTDENHFLWKDGKHGHNVRPFYVSPDRRPDYLPSPSSATNSISVPSTSSATVPQMSAAAPGLSRKRKQSKCSTEGCDCTGHKNPTKWASGHTTKAGCPLHK